MYKGDFARTLKLAEVLKDALSALSARRGSDVPVALRAQLFEFSAAAEDHPIYDRAGGLARSLAVLLESEDIAPPDEPGGQQLGVIISNLVSMLEGTTSEGRKGKRKSLVTPVSPSQSRTSRRVALYLDNVATVALIREPLAQAGFEPFTINSLSELIVEGLEECPVAIVADLDLCQLDPALNNTFAALRERFELPPHLFCLANFTDIPARLEAVRLGATRCFSKPLDVSRMISVLKGVSAQVPAKPFKVLLVEDDRTLGELYRLVMSDAGMETLVVANPLRAPEIVKRFEPDVVVSDVYMPGSNGLELLAVLRQDDALADTPIILLSSDDDQQCRLEAVDLGADDFLIKPVNVSVLVATVTARAKRARALKRSRSEYRRVLARMNQLEKHLPESDLEAFEVEMLTMGEVGSDDYEVIETDLPKT